MANDLTESMTDLLLVMDNKIFAVYAGYCLFFLGEGQGHKKIGTAVPVVVRKVSVQ